MGQVKAANISVKALQQELIALNNSSTKHDDWLGMIFKSFDTFQSSLKKFMHNVTKKVDNIEDYNLGGTATVTGIPDHLILERKIEDLDMYCIDVHLCIDELEPLINAGGDELQIDEVIIHSNQYLKARLVATDGEGVDFGGFICPYNILTHIQ